MRKKSIWLFFSALLLGLLFFTNKAGSEKTSNKKFILSTTGIIDSLVSEISGGILETKVLIDKEMDPHSYQIRKGDSEKIEQAFVVFANGLSLEHSPALYHKLKKNHAVFLGDEVLQNKPSLIIRKNGEIDPHIWMDLSIMQNIATSICQHLEEMDPEHKSVYQDNTEKLLMKMQILDQAILFMFSQIPAEKKYLVTSHDAFNYFVKRYFDNRSIDRLFSMQGLTPEAEVSLWRLKQVVEFVTAKKVQTIFFESNLPKDAAQKLLEVCQSIGLSIEICSDPLYGDTLGDKTYLEMMEHNAHMIAGKLKGAEDE